VSRGPGTAGTSDPSPWRRFLAAGIVPRVAVIVLGVPLVAWPAAHGGRPFALLVGALVLLGSREFLLLLRARGYQPLLAVGLLGAAAIWLGMTLGGLPGGALGLTAAVLAVALGELARPRPERPLLRIGTTLFGLLYVAWLGSHLVLLRAGAGTPPRDGLALLGLAAGMTWACDIAAYLVGVAVGRHPLLPQVSPRKSREGAAGGLLAAVGLAWLASRTFAPFLATGTALALGAAAGVAAQAGDLLESLLKRDAGVKDSSALLPGHGGVLDRFDSLLLVAPLVYYAARCGWL